MTGHHCKNHLTIIFRKAQAQYKRYILQPHKNVGKERGPWKAKGGRREQCQSTLASCVPVLLSHSCSDNVSTVQHGSISDDRKQIASASKRNKCRRNAFMKILPHLSISVLNECTSTVAPHWTSQAKVIICGCSMSNSDMQRDTLKMFPNVFHEGLEDGTWYIHFTLRSRNGCLLSFSFCLKLKIKK